MKYLIRYTDGAYESSFGKGHPVDFQEARVFDTYEDARVHALDLVDVDCIEPHNDEAFLMRKPYVIKPEDVIISTYCPSSRPQWMAHNDRGIRVTHIPIGIAVEKHDDRSQHRNKALAMKELQERLDKENISDGLSLQEKLKYANILIEESDIDTILKYLESKFDKDVLEYHKTTAIELARIINDMDERMKRYRESKTNLNF